ATTARVLSITPAYGREDELSMNSAEDVALSAACRDQRRLAGAVELSPQPLHINVDDVRERIVLIVPDMLGDIAPPDHLARVPREEFEQRVFARGEPDAAVAAASRARAGLDRQIADREHLGHDRPGA